MIYFGRGSGTPSDPSRADPPREVAAEKAVSTGVAINSAKLWKVRDKSSSPGRETVSPSCLPASLLPSFRTQEPSLRLINWPLCAVTCEIRLPSRVEKYMERRKKISNERTH